MSKKGVTRLFNIKFGKKGEISLVRAGANLREILLTKSQEESMEELLKELLENGFENEEQFEKRLKELLPDTLKKEDTERVSAGLKGAFSILSKIKDSLPEADRSKVMASLLKDAGFEIEQSLKKSSDLGNFLREQMKKAGISKADLAKAGNISEETMDAIFSGDVQSPSKNKLEAFAKALGVSADSLTKLLPSSVQKMHTEEEPVGAKVEVTKTEDKPDKAEQGLQDLRKELTEKYDSVVGDLQKENKNLSEDLQKEKDLRLQKDFEEKAKGFGYVGDKAVEIAKTLKEANDVMSKAGYEAIESQLEKAGKTLSNANLIKELGGGGTDSSTAEVKINKKVEDLMKSDEKLTKEQAEVKVYDRYPALYNDYLDENPKQGGF